MLRKKLSFPDGAALLAKAHAYQSLHSVPYGFAVVSLLGIRNKEIEETEDATEVYAWFYRTQVESFNPINPFR